MNGYIAFVEGKRYEIEAETLPEAEEEALKLYTGRKKYPSVAVVLAEKDGEPVVHTAVD